MDMTTKENVFINSATPEQEYTLSVYNRAKTFSRRPFTAPTQHNWLKEVGIPEPVPEGQEIIPEAKVEEDDAKSQKLPDFKPPSECRMIARDDIEGYRQEQLKEIESIKDCLAQNYIPQSIATLQRAILLPIHQEYIADQRKYPNAGVGLMKDPFPKKKKKKKGKKKKKKK